MSPKEKYWELFDSDQKMKSLPKGFTDQSGLLSERAFLINHELTKIQTIPSDLPDSICLSRQEIERIDKEAKDVHWALNYPSASTPPGFLETTCSRINQNKDACFVYNRLPRRDQERMQLLIERDKFGAPMYILEVLHFFPRNSHLNNVQNWTKGDMNNLGG